MQFRPCLTFRFVSRKIFMLLRYPLDHVRTLYRWNYGPWIGYSKQLFLHLWKNQICLFFLAHPVVTPSLVFQTFFNMTLVPLWEYFSRIEIFLPRYIPGQVILRRCITDGTYFFAIPDKAEQGILNWSWVWKMGSHWCRFCSKNT